MSIRYLGLVGGCALLLACGGDGWIPGPDDPGTDEPRPAAPEPSPGQYQPSALQSVVSQITLPSTGLEHGLDLNGDGVVDNQIGRILGQVRSLLNLDLQATLDQQLAAGKAILLYDVLARSLLDDTQAQVRAYLGVDADNNPSDNFSGNEAFGIQATLAESAVLPAAITGGRLASTSPGSGLVSFPFITATTTLPLRMTRIQADVGADGMQQGILAGAIHVSDTATYLAPVLAAELNRVYQQPGQLPVTVELLQLFLDRNGDGEISTEEFITSNAFGFLLHAADVDSDNDGQLDAISFGIAFKSVPCTIQAAD